MKQVICWWSGGITSAVACKIGIELFGLSNCRVVMIDTGNEHEDTYRFKRDCEEWYGKEIEVISFIGTKFDSIQHVWRRFKALNSATGAVCSAELKRKVRENWQKDVDFDYQIFGFEFDTREFKRAKSMKMNHTKAKAIYPLLMLGYDKEDCIKLIEQAGLEIPVMYKLGFRNNNCFGTGCVQGGIGYWQKMKRDFPDKFNKMADMEWELTELKGVPVTMLKDQGKEAKASGNELVFLRKHPKYPNLKCIDDMKECKVEPLFECNGFCGTNDLNERSKTEDEINFDTSDL